MSDFNFEQIDLSEVRIAPQFTPGKYFFPMTNVNQNGDNNQR